MSRVDSVVDVLHFSNLQSELVNLFFERIDRSPVVFVDPIELDDVCSSFVSLNDLFGELFDSGFKVSVLDPETFDI